MAPKAKAKVKAKARVRRPPLVRGVRRPARAGLRRPAAAAEEAPPGDGASRRWEEGHVVPLHQLDPREVRKCRTLVIDKAFYYHQEAKVAGVVTGVWLEEESYSLKMQLTGTTGEAASHWEPRHRVSGSRLSAHLQPRGGGRQHTPRRSRSSGEGKRRRGGLDFQHGDSAEGCRGRRRVGPPAREGQGGRAAPGTGGAEGQKPRERQEQEQEAQDKKGKEREERQERTPGGKRKVRQEKEERVEPLFVRSLRGSADGWHSGQAGQSQGGESTLSGYGAGSPRPGQVARLARRHLRKRAEKSSSSNTGTSSSGSSVDGLDKSEETIFEAASKVRVISEAYPGALANQAINQMRLTLLQEVGFEDRPNVLYPAAVAYYRQHFAASGHRADPTGAPDASSWHRPLIEREASECPRRHGAEVQVNRTDADRKPLDGEPAVGDLASRFHYTHGRAGVSLCSERSVRRGQSEVLLRLPRGQSWQRSEGAVKGKRRRKREGRSRSGSRQERRKRSGQQGRCCSQERLKPGKDREEEVPTGVQPRAYALDQASESGKTEEDRSYEGGMELASPSDETLATGALHGERPDQVYEQPPQSLHVTPSKSGAQRIPFVQMELPEPTGTGVRSLEMSDSGTFCSLKKADALPGLEGHVLGSCGHVLLQRLLEVLSLRSQPRGKRDKRSLFPLPTSREVLVAVACDLLEDEISWMIAVCVSLNSLWGDVLFYDGLPNKGQELCLAEIKDQVRRFCGMKAVIEDLDWNAFFKVKSVDYQGDEVKLARWFDWSNIAPALPPEIGKVPLEDVCTLGCRHYVECFDQFLKPCEDWTVVRAPRVMVDDSSWGAVCTGLIDAGVCVLLEASEVFHVNDVPLLNGLFGVPKDETTADGTEVFRLIMNMTPLNALCMPMSGDIDTLPSWGAMSPFFLQAQWVPAHILWRR